MLTLVAAMFLSGGGPAGPTTPTAVAWLTRIAEVDARYKASIAKANQTRDRVRAFQADAKESIARAEALRRLIEADKAAEKAKREERRIDD